MKNNNKKTTVTILSILAGIIYLITIFPYFEAGYEGGIRNVKEQNKMESDGVVNSAKGSRVLQRIQLTPKNIDILYSDSIVNIKTVKEKINTRIMGNVSTQLLQQGPEERIINITKNCIISGTDIVSPACGLSMSTSIENLKSMTQYVKEAGCNGTY